MTCIIGLIKNDKVYIGGDSAGVGGLNITIRKDPKVFKVGDFIIGCTTSFRMINLLRFNLKPPKMYEGQGVYEYMCTDFIEAIRKVFKQGGYAKVDKGEESGGTFLIGYKNRLFEIEDDFQVAESMESYNSCGCGKYYALGALNQLNSMKDLTPEEIIKGALDTAVKFSGGVRPPFVIEHT